jgi:Uma2 family endonuclease
MIFAQSKKMQLVVEIPATREQQLDFNRKRWADLLKDPVLAKHPYRIETNAHGQIIMMPPASGGHRYRQSQILTTLQAQLGGVALPECPVSTINGVRAADVGWYSTSRFAEVKGQIAFETAPEICVEVLSPDNTPGEMEEKKTLYFEAGAEEFWLGDLEGNLTFFTKTASGSSAERSVLASEFPTQLDP